MNFLGILDQWIAFGCDQPWSPTVEYNEAKRICFDFGVALALKEDDVFKAYANMEEYYALFGHRNYFGESHGKAIELSLLSAYLCRVFKIGWPGSVFSENKAMQLRANAVALKTHLTALLGTQSE